MGSIFAELKLGDDFYTISASLRYERYRAKGKTQTPGTTRIYQSTVDMVAQSACAQAGNMTLTRDENYREIYREGCRIAQTGDLAALKAWWDADPAYLWYSTRKVRDPSGKSTYVRTGKTSVEHLNSIGGHKRELETAYPSKWLEDQPALYDYDVDRSAGKVLPALSAAIRPARWLELYGSWGKSWRPRPSMNC